MGTRSLIVPIKIAVPITNRITASNDTSICPAGINCVDTADSAYCDCGDGYSLSNAYKFNILAQFIVPVLTFNRCKNVSKKM